jgi:hypothetical protein
MLNERAFLCSMSCRSARRAFSCSNFCKSCS